MLKGHLDAIVLAALEAGPAHGYAIIETIKQRSAGTFDLPEGTVARLGAASRRQSTRRWKEGAHERRDRRLCRSIAP